jgi:hypothetical protein
VAAKPRQPGHSASLGLFLPSPSPHLRHSMRWPAPMQKGGPLCSGAGAQLAVLGGDDVARPRQRTCRHIVGDGEVVGDNSFLKKKPLPDVQQVEQVRVEAGFERADGLTPACCKDFLPRQNGVGRTKTLSGRSHPRSSLSAFGWRCQPLVDRVRPRATSRRALLSDAPKSMSGSSRRRLVAAACCRTAASWLFSASMRTGSMKPPPRATSARLRLRWRLSSPHPNREESFAASPSRRPAPAPLPYITRSARHPVPDRRGRKRQRAMRKHP